MFPGSFPPLKNIQVKCLGMPQAYVSGGTIPLTLNLGTRQVKIKLIPTTFLLHYESDKNGHHFVVFKSACNSMLTLQSTVVVTSAHVHALLE
jgi:hypothetical protein